MPLQKTSPRPTERWRSTRTALLAALLSACATTPQPGSFRLHSADSILESDGADAVQVARYAGGRLHGAEAFGAMQPGLRSMVHDRTPTDHPLLEVWRQQLAGLHALVLDPDTTAREIRRAVAGLPFRAAIDDAVLRHVDGDPLRAARALDAGDELGISRAVSLRLLETALQGSDLDDIRAAGWLRTFIETDNLPAVRELARSSSFGPRAAMAGLSELERFAPRDRRALFSWFASPLVDRPGRADLLVDSLAVLPREERGAAASRLLEGGSPRLHLVLVQRLAELPEHERLDLLTEVVQSRRFVGEIQMACVHAAKALPDHLTDLALAEIAASGRLEPATRELIR